MTRTREPTATESYARGTPRSGSHYLDARGVLPGGVAKGAFFQEPHPFYAAAAGGVHVTTVDGQRLLDFRGHHTAAVLGHGHPAVLAAARDQLERALAPGAPTEVEYALAAELAHRVPSIERVRFTTSGTEAAAHAVRLARGWTGRTKIAKFEGAYHGGSDALEVSVAPPPAAAGPADSPLPVPNVRGIPASAVGEVVVLPYNRREAVTRLLERHHEELAAVLLDPRAGVLPIDREFVRFVRRITEELQLLLILDEVVSFRLSPAGLQGLCGIRPDLTILGKIIGGGFPVGAFGGRADLMDLLAGGSSGFFQSGTFSGHPVALAAGLATLRQLTPPAFAHLDALGERLRAGCASLFDRYGVRAQAVGDGSLFSLHLTGARLRDYRDLRTADRAAAHRLFLRLLGEGVLLAPGLQMSAASTPMDESHVLALLGALEAALRQESHQETSS